MSPDARVEIDARGRRFGTGVLADLALALPDLAEGDLVAIRGDDPALGEEIAQWSQLTGHSLVATAPTEGAGTRYLIRKGEASGRMDETDVSNRRLWLYANFDCNLACDYCCVRSSPKAPRRALGPERVARLAEEARALGFTEIFLTGGEPFMLPDLEAVARAATDALPTTLLTNAMLFKGSRLDVLKRLPSDRLALQVSLDSPEPALHDAHRGAGSWARAVEGIGIARGLGFRVRVAATVSSEGERAAMEKFLEAEGVPPRDRVIRPVALRGESKSGLALARADVRPEVTVTADGVYWHPVGATDEDFLVSREIFPLASALARVREMEAQDRAVATRMAEVFRCA